MNDGGSHESKVHPQRYSFALTCLKNPVAIIAELFGLPYHVGCVSSFELARGATRHGELPFEALLGIGRVWSRFEQQKRVAIEYTTSAAWAEIWQFDARSDMVERALRCWARNAASRRRIS